MKKALVIGGSRLLGPRLVELLLHGGYETVIFNRGTRQMRPEWKTVKMVVGDRNSEEDLQRMASSDFSLVFDTCCYEPQQAKMVVKVFNGCVDHYVYVSSVAAYREPSHWPLTEEAPLGEWKLWGNYGLNKARTDQVFAELFQSTNFPITVIRPSYVLGVANHVEREAFFVSRLLNGIPIVVPGDGQARIHFVFADEVALAMLMLAEADSSIGEAFNCVTDRSVSLEEFVRLCARLLNVNVQIIYADERRFGISNEPYDAPKLSPFSNMPVTIDNNKLKMLLGYSFNPLEKQLSSVLGWYARLQPDLPVNLRPKEKEVLISANFKEIVDKYVHK